MTSVKILDEKLKELPEEACLELLEYVDYLLYKYAGDSPSDSQYDTLMQELLTKRYQSHPLAVLVVYQITKISFILSRQQQICCALIRLFSNSYPIAYCHIEYGAAVLLSGQVRQSVH